jgi:hypothetical protein
MSRAVHRRQQLNVSWWALYKAAITGLAARGEEKFIAVDAAAIADQSWALWQRRNGTQDSEGKIVPDA